MTELKIPDEELIQYLRTIYETLVLLDEEREDHEQRLRKLEAQHNTGGRE